MGSRSHSPSSTTPFEPSRLCNLEKSESSDVRMLKITGNFWPFLGMWKGNLVTDWVKQVWIVLLITLPLCNILPWLQLSNNNFLIWPKIYLTTTLHTLVITILSLRQNIWVKGELLNSNWESAWQRGFCELTLLAYISVCLWETKRICVQQVDSFVLLCVCGGVV